MGTVKSSAEAVRAAQQMQQIINNGLEEQIRQLNAEGEKLSNPQFFEGQHAKRFREEWPQINASLKKTQQALTELRQKTQNILQAIIDAGGGF